MEDKTKITYPESEKVYMQGATPSLSESWDAKSESYPYRSSGKREKSYDGECARLHI